MANLPISYIILKLGAPAYTAMAIASILAFVTTIWRAFLLHDLINLPYKKYLNVIVRLTIATTISGICSYLITMNNTTGFLLLILSSCASFFLTCVLYYFWVLGKEERKILYGFVGRILKRQK